MSIFPQFRDDVVSQKNGSAVLHTKYHYDDMVSIAVCATFYIKYTRADGTRPLRLTRFDTVVIVVMTRAIFS